MAEKKRYYWIRLKDSFMTGDEIDFLMSQKNGAEYVVLYQMDCNLDSVLLTKLDGDSDDPLEEDDDFTFEDYDILQEFTKIQ